MTYSALIVSSVVNKTACSTCSAQEFSRAAHAVLLVMPHMPYVAASSDCAFHLQKIIYTFPYTPSMTFCYAHCDLPLHDQEYIYRSTA